MLNLIGNICYHKNKLIVGKDDELFLKIRRDMEYFKNITNNSVIVMGRKTWFSIPQNQRPLENRYNIILTRNKELLDEKKNLGTYKYMTYSQFTRWHHKHTDKKIFVIGGGEIYNLFLQETNINKPQKLYITDSRTSRIEYSNIKNLTSIDYIPKEYKIVSVSEKFKSGNTYFRFLVYHLTSEESSEDNYIKLLELGIEYGKERIDRTGTGTISLFCKQARFDISDNVPLLTSKYIGWKTCIEELLWFLRGDTDTNILSKKGITIWKGNTSRKFLDSRNLTYSEGILGPGIWMAMEILWS